jgi:hypothetical protein
MRTTLDIPDEVYKNIKRLAVEENTTVRQIVLDALQVAVEKRKAQAPPRRMKLPIIRSSKPGTLDIDNEKIYDIIGFP